MQATDLQVSEVFEALQGKLLWQWETGENGGHRKFDATTVTQARSSVDLVGYLNFIHPHRIPVLGVREVAYFQQHIQEEPYQKVWNALLALNPPAIVVADAQTVPSKLLELCEALELPLLSTAQPAADVIDVLRSYLAKSFAQKTSMHGVFMDIFGVGVLLQGESGLGKSELGLELITRGHRLIADDVVDFSLIAQAVVEGKCPKLLENFLEVRGIGLLNIRTIFGETAMRRKMRLRLVVRLIRREIWEQEFDRLPTDVLEQDILGVNIHEVVIPVQAGRNIAVLIEAAVRNTVLQIRGIDTYQEFVARQRKAMKLDSSDEA